LSGIIANYKEDLNTSKEKLRGVYDKLNGKVTREICEEILEKIDLKNIFF